MSRLLKQSETRLIAERDGGPRYPGPAEPALVGRLARTLRKYFKIFRVSLVERLTYRSDFFLSTLLRFLPMLTTILLWEAIFAGSGQYRLGGFARKEMISYLLLVH